MPTSTRFGRSVLSPNMPTFPLNAGSNRSITLVIVGLDGRKAFTCSGSQPIAGQSDCQAIVNLLPGSYDGVLHRDARVRVEVRSLVRGQRYQVVQPEQLVEDVAVRDDDDVPARRLARRELRLDLAEEPGVGVDRFAVRRPGCSCPS